MKPQGETEQGEQQQIKVVLERGKARMLDPIGQSVLVDQDKVRDALKQGYTVETPEHVQQREIAQEKTREREEQYTTAAIIGGIVVLIAGLKFLHFLGMKKSLMFGGAILLASNRSGGELREA